MAPPLDPNARARQEIDDFHRRLTDATHYELLGVDRQADTDTIRQAYQARSRRFSPEAFSTPLTNASMQRLEAIQEALDTALAILSDPVRRYLYNQELDARRQQAPPSTRPREAPSKRTPAPGTLQPPLNNPRPSGTSTPNFTRTPTPSEGFRAPIPPAPISPKPPSPPPTDPLGVLQDASKPPPSRASSDSPPLPPPHLKQTGPQPVDARYNDTITPAVPDPSSDHRIAALEAQVQTLQKEVASLLAEVERLAVAIQLTIARQLEPNEIHPDQLVSAGQALVSSRVTLATLLAQREERMGHWETASALWQRAFRARPTDVKLLVHAANALRKANTNMAGAEALARQAVALDPDDPEAQSALAIIEARRNTSI